MGSLGGETVSDWAKILSVVRGIVDIVAYQNLCTVELWFVRYELITEVDKICGFSVWQGLYLLLDSCGCCHSCAKCIMVNVLLLVYPLKVVKKTPFNHLLIIVEAWSGPIGPVGFYSSTRGGFLCKSMCHLCMWFLLFCCISIGGCFPQWPSQDEGSNWFIATTSLS